MRDSNIDIFDCIENYIALLSCILNPKLTPAMALKRIGIEDDNKNKYNGKSKFRKIKVIDTLTNKELIFDSVYEAEKYTGINKVNIYVYIKRDILGKKRYKFSYYE
ncbi:hypothetical protein UMC2_23881 [[Clostridium] sordellii]|uniref:hypothetical protein n=1 Tax=Paraclostridium sordellii TaxID=1505 RepID=UPI00054220E6|nr:hypothetical protein [Paeniclostridium sordellii]CEK35432.1 hypothetical protein UMC2_23881 [[Clostridium] sordellii] [Paeniclostridium sordellii]